ncbi:MAG: peroxidase family protein [Gammaproteobacteria bacterium]|nr:peroxidase family protein [Gammaproteobacteria bacterium]
MKKPCIHGTSKARGCSHAELGRFGVMFEDLQSWGVDVSDVPGESIAPAEAARIAALLGAAGGVMDGGLEANACPSAVPAGYTFFAQFVDHDVTLDVTTALHGEDLRADNSNHKVEKLPNLRTASLDLDCVYGLGPEASPYLYSADGTGVMLTGHADNPDDLARNHEGRALIGDPRNDENIFVSQMQLLFVRFHNCLMAGRSFEEAQRQARFHYQYVVWNDFLRRISDPDVFAYLDQALRDAAAAFNGGDNNYDPKGLFDLVDKCHRPLMPVEFSVAAYRFGHVTVRSNYPVNKSTPVVELFDERFSTLGFSPVPQHLVADWRFLLPVDPGITPVMTKAFDHHLVDELIRLPDPIVSKRATDNERSLAFRNLLRGYVLGLPSGQNIADAVATLGIPVNPNQDLDFAGIPGWGEIDAATRTKLEEHTPLFFYLMREAGHVGGGQHLGPVGTALLLRTFGSMLLNCKSYLTEAGHAEGDAPCGEPQAWQPLPEIAGDAELELADIVRYVGR